MEIDFEIYHIYHLLILREYICVIILDKFVNIEEIYLYYHFRQLNYN